MHKGHWLGVFAAALVFLRLPALGAQSLSAQPFDFSFSAVAGAGGYLVEVKDNSGKIVISQSLKADQTTVSLSLVPGPYQLRLTTLNRLQHAESATEWMAIHVPAAGPPTVSSMDAQTIMTGKAQSVRLKVQGLASDALASVQPPSGKEIPATIGWSGPSTIEIHIPALLRAGHYKLILTNPPDLSLTVSDKLWVKYPLPRVTRIDPTSFEQGDGTAELHLGGKDFSPEVTVEEATKSSPETSNLIPLKVTNSDTETITAQLPPNLGAASYLVTIANASDAPAASAGKIAVIVSNRAPSMTLTHTYGTISVQSQSPGKLYLDGKLMGALDSGASAKLNTVQTGSHMLLMHYDDGEVENVPVVVGNGESAAISFSHRVGALPIASIKINGNFDEWNGIPPALIGNSTQRGSLFIDKVHLAVDEQNLYMRFDIKDDTKSSFFHPNNFDISHDWNEYGLMIQYQSLELGVRVGCNRKSRWTAVVFKKPRPEAQGVNIAPETHEVVMKGSSLEAAFPLKVIREYLGPLTPGMYYKIHAYVWYHDGGYINGIAPDYTQSRAFTF
jgi:hypothetical protein